MRDYVDAVLITAAFILLMASPVILTGLLAWAAP